MFDPWHHTTLTNTPAFILVILFPIYKSPTALRSLNGGVFVSVENWGWQRYSVGGAFVSTRLCCVSFYELLGDLSMTCPVHLILEEYRLAVSIDVPRRVYYRPTQVKRWRNCRKVDTILAWSRWRPSCFMHTLHESVDVNSIHTVVYSVLDCWVETSNSLPWCGKTPLAVSCFECWLPLVPNILSKWL